MNAATLLHRVPDDHCNEAHLSGSRRRCWLLQDASTATKCGLSVPCWDMHFWPLGQLFGLWHQRRFCFCGRAVNHCVPFSLVIFLFFKSICLIDACSSVILSVIGAHLSFIVTFFNGCFNFVPGSGHVLGLGDCTMLSLGLYEPHSIHLLGNMAFALW